MVALPASTSGTLRRKATRCPAPSPPFTPETAIEKVRLAEDGWNTRDAGKVALAYTLDTRWRNRVECATSGRWFRAYGNENWLFAADGLMSQRHASINEMPIDEAQREYRWPLVRRPDDHPGSGDLGL